MAFLNAPFRDFATMLRTPGVLFKGPRALGVRVINKSGSSIAVNKLVAISGYDTTSKLPKIVLADANASNLATEVFVTKKAIANNAKGDVFTSFLSTATLDTSGVTTVGDPVYLDTTAGAFSATAPTGGDARQVLVGFTQVKSSTVGQVLWGVQYPAKFGSFDHNGLGFAAGEGGTVTQATSKSTTAVLSKKTGEVTMNGAALAADTTVAFTLTNTFIELGDFVAIQHVSAGTQAAYIVTAVAAAGSATVNVHNATPGSLSEAIVLKFVVIKAATA